MLQNLTCAFMLACCLGHSHLLTYSLKTTFTWDIDRIFTEVINLFFLRLLIYCILLFTQAFPFQTLKGTVSFLSSFSWLGEKSFKFLIRSLYELWTMLGLSFNISFTSPLPLLLQKWSIWIEGAMTRLHFFTREQ